jgi:hexulose-6-phosphate isomerase
MRPIGIMQGRLIPPEAGRFQCFPRTRWRDEFPLAHSAGLERIEWIYDEYGHAENPIATDAGCAEIRRCSDDCQVLVRSLVADYFMDQPLVRAADQFEPRVTKLRWLIGRCGLIGIERLTIPFVDASRIESPADADAVVAAVRAALPAAAAARMEIHLETSLAPAEFADLLDRLDDPLVKVNYDSGNSASLGYSVVEEFAAYGSRVGSVHIKDRIRGGGTVPLGKGDADLPALFEALGRANYQRDLILQVARGAPGDEVTLARYNRQYVESLQSSRPGAHPQVS